ncbi:GNAT family N-acetyltransferase [Candidatus Methylobacter oryzae]|uniref:GNAT family N-acetyltransferase n=1 Tax=Candidatus Methylobacter oryzae TaxID=2497749 RepID=A0ABY3CBJ6_9GAMM|nr:GNAT family N-acetyltransferase [Candidatus Methylobacter oryzae]TRW96415.1 GNAT family N-acetyltransferase [Candidatus Methylobacter oryzae]
MTIHLGTPYDLDTVMRLKGACVLRMQQMNIDQWDEAYPNRISFEEDINQGNLYLYSLDDLLIACAVLNENQDSEYQEVNWAYHAENIAVIHRLMVHPEYWGKGIASKLMSSIENIAVSMGYSIIRLDAFLKNPSAISLYTKLGYRHAGKVAFRKGQFMCFEKRIDGVSAVDFEKHGITVMHSA